MLVYLHLHYVSQFIKLAARLPGERSFYGSVNLKSIFSWNFIVQKLNEIFDKILPYEARAEFCQIFRSFLGNGDLRKIAFEINWPLDI